MCGRYVQITGIAELMERFGLAAARSSLDPRYNLAPGQAAPVVFEAGERVLGLMRWGLVPQWAEAAAAGRRMINARAETLARKPSFREAFARRRCLVPADGFYEWRADPGRRGSTPMYVTLRSGEPFAFAGLFERWHPQAARDAAAARSRPRAPASRPACADVQASLFDTPEEEAAPDVLDTFTFVTTEPNELLAPIHSRMPAILPRDAEAAWLDPANRNVSALAALLGPFPSDALSLRAVRRHVNDIRNDGPECIAPVRERTS